MNNAFNHGSQGDFFATELDPVAEIKPSSAPSGTGNEIRLAASDGKIEKLATLLKKWKNDSVINEGDEIGTTALHTAASHGHKQAVEMLLTSGADKTIKISTDTQHRLKLKSQKLSPF